MGVGTLGTLLVRHCLLRLWLLDRCTALGLLPTKSNKLAPETTWRQNKIERGHEHKIIEWHFICNSINPWPALRCIYINMLINDIYGKPNYKSSNPSLSPKLEPCFPKLEFLCLLRFLGISKTLYACTSNGWGIGHWEKHLCLFRLHCLGEGVDQTCSKSWCGQLKIQCEGIPIITAVTEKNVTGALKKIIPDTATGNLFSAPAILSCKLEWS